MSSEKIRAFLNELGELEEKYNVHLFACDEFYPEEVDEVDNGYRSCLFIHDNESGNAINIQYGLSEMEGLKPCPFCGGRWQHTELSTEGISCVRHVCTITCAFCGCQISFNSHTPEAAEGFAVEAWNTRA